LNNVFVDTSFVVALVNEKDQHHHRAVELADLFDAYPCFHVKDDLHAVKEG
jgi:predicted nucleic acid-binding protein